MGMTLLVAAGAGVSQDWQWDQLQNLFEHITPEDRVLVVPTHCERQWFVADQPAYTHVNVANLPEQLGVEVAEAIRHYCVHLQRPDLDLQHQAHRLGWRCHVPYAFPLQKTPLPPLGIPRHPLRQCRQ